MRLNSPPPYLLFLSPEKRKNKLGAISVFFSIPTTILLPCFISVFSAYCREFPHLLHFCGGNRIIRGQNWVSIWLHFTLESAFIFGAFGRKHSEAFLHLNIKGFWLQGSRFVLIWNSTVIVCFIFICSKFDERVFLPALISTPRVFVSTARNAGNVQTKACLEMFHRCRRLIGQSCRWRCFWDRRSNKHGKVVHSSFGFLLMSGVAICFRFAYKHVSLF